MMADTRIGRILPTEVISPIQSYDRGTGSLHDALSAHIAWLGSLHTPTLRVTAVVCIGLGVVLARRGWAHL